MWTKIKNGLKEVDGKNIPVYKYVHEDGKVRIIEQADDTWNVQVSNKHAKFRRGKEYEV
jgi:hypothetical protein